jgi:transposase
VDTRADVHVAAALDPVGGLLGVREFPVTAAGYTGLLGWLGEFGTVCLVGIEGTGSYGADLARRLSAAGVRLVEVDRAAGSSVLRAGFLAQHRGRIIRPRRPVPGVAGLLSSGSVAARRVAWWCLQRTGTCSPRW